MNRSKFSVLIISLLLLGLHVSGQKSIKFGHINTQEMFQMMPESDSARLKLQRFTSELEQALEQMQVELNNMYEDYLKNREKWPNLVRQTKEQELQEKQNRIQMYQMEAEQDLQNERTQIFKPIYDKLNSAIEKVGQEQGFTYIFDISSGAVKYKSEASVDVTELVKKSLGL